MGYPYPNFCLCAFLGPYLRELGRLRLKVLIAVCMLLLLPVGAASLQALQGLRTWGSSGGGGEGGGEGFGLRATSKPKGPSRRPRPHRPAKKRQLWDC